MSRSEDGRAEKGSPYVTNTTMREVTDALRGAKRVCILTHSRPDGDAAGSAIAVARAVRHFGGTAEIVLHGDIPAPIERIAAAHGYRRDLPARHSGEEAGGAATADRAATDAEPDLIVIVDTGSWSQLEEADPWLRSRRERTIVLDHHLRGDDVAARRIVEPRFASTTQLLLRLLVDEAGLDLGVTLAEPLFVGLATDTGWFRHANAGAEVFADAARLLASGVDKVRLYREIEESHPAARLRLEAKALASMTWCANDRAAVMTLTAEDFEASGGEASMLSGLVNMPLIVGSVEAVALLVESGAQRIKVSFRAKSGSGGPPQVDVNVLAGRFGGGGHAQAAGARLSMTLEEARDAVARAFEDALSGDAPKSGG